MTRIVFATVALAAIYALALASANPWDLGIGAVLGLGVVIAFRGFILPETGIPALLALRRAAHVPALILATGIDIVRGTVQVARAVLASSPPNDAGFVVIPQGERTETGVAISGLLDTLSPGSVLIDTDPEDRTWTIHALDASEKQEIRTNAERFYGQYQRPVWP